MDTLKIPFYARAALIFIGLIAFISILYFAREIIVPILYATIFAILLSPIVELLVRRKVNRVLAITFTMIIVSVMIILLCILLTHEFSVFTDTFPRLLDKFYETLQSAVKWVSLHFHISPVKINSYITDTKTALMNSSRSTIGITLFSIGNILVFLFLIPVYVFMILFYQPLLLDFIHRVFGKTNTTEVNEVLTSIKSIIRRYLVALMVEASIIATLNSAGLLIIGIDYAVLLGILGALLNMIPYIGGILAVLLPMMVAFVTKSSSSYTVMVMLVYMLIQFIDNHYIFPRVVSSKVRINALISLVVVLGGGALWGISGMFLSIPIIAIFKVIFDHIEIMKPWGFLLGDTMPPIAIFKIKRKKKLIIVK